MFVNLKIPPTIISATTASAPTANKIPGSQLDCPYPSRNAQNNTPNAIVPEARKIELCTHVSDPLFP